jgi:hypothetical protein
MLVVHDPGDVKGAWIDDFGVVARVLVGIVAQGQDGLSGVVVFNRVTGPKIRQDLLKTRRRDSVARAPSFGS